MHAQARTEWASLLDKMHVNGGSAKQRMLFDSTLFQSFASIRLVARKGESITDTAGQTRTAAYDRYGPVPFWDTGRDQIVPLELLEREVTANVMQSELDMARERGFMNTSFHGDNAVFLYSGAIQRGIPFDYQAAYAYLRKNATDPRGRAAIWRNMIATGGSPTKFQRRTRARPMPAARQALQPRWNMRGTTRLWRTLPRGSATATTHDRSRSARAIIATCSIVRPGSCAGAPLTASGLRRSTRASLITMS